MKKKFTTIRTEKGQFEVFNDGDNYFLKYLENDNHHLQGVGYLVKENGAGYNGDYYLQEAFFDKHNRPYTSLRSILSDCDANMNKDLWDNLYAACYQIEEQFWCEAVSAS